MSGVYLLVLLTAALLSAIPARATTVLEVDVDTLAAAAELIFEGEVIAVESRQVSAGMINTYVTFQIRDVIKGDYNAQTLELRFAGGAANGRRVEISGMRQPTLGETGIYFVESLDRQLVNPLLGWSQGHFIIEQDENGIRRVSTADRQPVTAIQPISGVPQAIRRPQGAADGVAEVATGVEVSRDRSQRGRAMSVGDFKARITNLID